MNIIEEIKKLQLPAGEYIVVGSGIMDVLGIKPANDIDLVVTLKLFKKLEVQGWQNHPRPNGRPGLENGIVAAYLEVNSGDCNPTFQELLREAHIAQDISFISLERLLCFKKAYGRQKDLADIKLIERYLQSTANTVFYPIPWNRF